jgi:uroporphyrin-III C-methyltransferase
VITFVGAGPGDPGLLTRRGRDMLRAATLVVSDRSSLDEIASLAPAAAERILVGRRRGGRAWPLDAVVDLLAERDARGARVVRLKSGDLFVAARTAEETAALDARGIAYTLVPGVSAAVAAPAAAGIPVTRRDLTPAFSVIVGNDDPLYPEIGWDALAAAGGSLVVLTGRAHQAPIAQRLLAAGVDPATPVAVVHAGTRHEQQVQRGTLAELAVPGSLRLPPPATLVIGAVAALDVRSMENLVRSARAHP